MIQLLKNDSLQYLKALAEAFGEIKGFDSKIEFAKEISRSHSDQKIKLIRQNLFTTKELIQKFVPVMYSIFGFILPIIVTLLALVLTFYLDFNLEVLRENQSETLRVILVNIGVPLLFLYIIMFYGFFRFIRIFIIVSTFISICDLALEESREG
ncbi:hypothetical protein EJF36_19310 [Bacillus sp. HMF5848]|uniref:hypothetical protein n=1 Tax=Bacillus sp. HMF5848 TaxID=2495421 RepID=UPI000F796AF9|nr:hypothetical protein [Bacillus sp. HMF5848]RSK28849.1 hypothetical protein EJF36_19310 [Bacillus sp. HMF5848]